MSLRARVNFAWFLRRLAKALGAAADRIDPIKLDLPIRDSAEWFTGSTSKSQAQAAIRRAMYPHGSLLGGAQREPRR